jgi:hypothetical protein
VRQAVLLRDALGELARVFFDRPEPVPIMTRWVPSTTPGLLEGAARFGGGSDEPLVSVFVAPRTLDHDAIARVADWSRGRIIEVQQGTSVRTSMSDVAFRCAIVLGGDVEVREDADHLQRHLALQQSGLATHLSVLKVFAVASTGGVAAERYQADPHAYGASESDLELVEPTSYTVLMKRILDKSYSPPGRTPTTVPLRGPHGPYPSHGATVSTASELFTQVKKLIGP